MNKRIGLRIDVDTARGYKQGIIPIIKVLNKFKIQASFFLVTGYDSPLAAFPRFFTEKGFVRRVFRLKDALSYGNIFYSKESVKSCISRIIEERHEICLHGYRHFQWQSNLKKWSEEKIYEELKYGVEGFKEITDSYPRSFAAPGWVTKEEVFYAEEKFRFDYCSDTRGTFSYYPFVGGKQLKTVQVPVTLPTLDEFVVLGEENRLIEIKVRNNDVYCAHAEFDGMKYLEIFEQFVERKVKDGFKFVPLSVIKDKSSDTPVCEIEYKKIPGRTSTVACQGRKVRG
jgi:undecaprenyl phosphate-alpha-L-ara4FN deformylase